MLLSDKIKDDPDSRFVVFLNDRPVIAVQEADDEEGWVEVPDLFSMAPLDPEVAHNTKESGDPIGPGADISTEEWEEIPILRKHGRVEIRKI